MEWFKLWYEDKQSILDTMVRNLTADLNAGYNWWGQSASRQRVEIDEYKARFDDEIEMLKLMDEKKAERWCRLDLIKRGAIAV